MKTVTEFLFEPCRLQLYLWLALGLACFLGVCGAPRHFRERKDDGRWMRAGESIRAATWDAMVHFIGFVLAPILMLFVSTISEASSSPEKIVLGILFLPLFFYMIFCVSGRGVEVLHRTIMSGTKSIDITWRGIKIEFEKKE